MKAPWPLIACCFAVISAVVLVGLAGCEPADRNTPPSTPSNPPAVSGEKPSSQTTYSPPDESAAPVGPNVGYYPDKSAKAVAPPTTYESDTPTPKSEEPASSYGRTTVAPPEAEEPSPDEAKLPDETEEGTPDPSSEQRAADLHKKLQEAADLHKKLQEVEERLADEQSPPIILGPPLGEDVSKLIPLQQNPVVWVDKDNHRVILVGQVCQRVAPLEMFACPSGTKEHEAVVSVPTKAMDIHAALLRVGAEQGTPVQFHPEYKPATGAEVEIEVRWKDKNGKVQSARAQEWVRNMKTRKAMDHNWVFAGSSFWTDEQTGKQYYQADSGDFICVSNFPSAMLDLPIESSQKDGELMFEAFTENIPPLGTPVTLVLMPKIEKVKKKAE